MHAPPRATEPTVCLELLFITVFLWAAIWGVIDLFAQRLADDTQRTALYVVLAAVAGLLIWLTPGLTTCRVL